MKRSKLFLGLTTLCLAVAGAVAAKATHFGNIKAFYYTVSNHCVQATSACARTTVKTLTCLTSAGSAAYYTASNCRNIFKYDGQQ